MEKKINTKQFVVNGLDETESCMMLMRDMVNEHPLPLADMHATLNEMRSFIGITLARVEKDLLKHK